MIYRNLSLSEQRRYVNRKYDERMSQLDNIRKHVVPSPTRLAEAVAWYLRNKELNRPYTATTITTEHAENVVDEGIYAPPKQSKLLLLDRIKPRHETKGSGRNVRHKQLTPYDRSETRQATREALAQLSGSDEGSIDDIVDDRTSAQVADDIIAIERARKTLRPVYSAAPGQIERPDEAFAQQYIPDQSIIPEEMIGDGEEHYAIAPEHDSSDESRETLHSEILGRTLKDLRRKIRRLEKRGEDDKAKFLRETALAILEGQNDFPAYNSHAFHEDLVDAACERPH